MVLKIFFTSFSKIFNCLQFFEFLLFSDFNDLYYSPTKLFKSCRCVT